MSPENPIEHAVPSYVESQSFDPNKHERVEIFIRLEDLSTKFFKTKTITNAEASEILKLMDELAEIGYFATDAMNPHVPDEDLEGRGIDPERQEAVEYEFTITNMAQFTNLLENIYSATDIPPRFIDQIAGKVNAQKMGMVSGAGQISQVLYRLDAQYDRI